MGTPRVMTHSAVATKLSKLGQARHHQLPSPVCWLGSACMDTDLSNSVLHPQPNPSEMRHWNPGERREMQTLICSSGVGVRFKM